VEGGNHVDDRHAPANPHVVAAYCLEKQQEGNFARVLYSCPHPRHDRVDRGRLLVTAPALVGKTKQVTRRARNRTPRALFCLELG
jgi:hypothetical protein